MNVRETLSEMLIFLGIVSAIFLTGLVFALSFDLVYGLAAALACSLLFLFIDFRRIDWITRWLEKPSLAEIPEVSQYNSWYRVLDRLRQNREKHEKDEIPRNTLPPDAFDSSRRSGADQDGMAFGLVQ